MANIHSEVNQILTDLGIPFGKGFYIGDGTQKIWIVYLPFGDEPTGFAEDREVQRDSNVQFDIIAIGGEDFIETEERLTKAMEDAGFSFSGGNDDIDEETYWYHRNITFKKKYYRNALSV